MQHTTPGYTPYPVTESLAAMEPLARAASSPFALATPLFLDPRLSPPAPVLNPTKMFPRKRPAPPSVPSQSMSSHIARIEAAIRAHILENEEDFLGSVGGVTELSRRTEEFRDGVRELRRSFARVISIFLHHTTNYRTSK